MFEDKPLADAVNNLAKQVKASIREVNQNLAAIVAALNNQGERIVATIADLKAAVEANGVVVQSAIVLIEGIAQALKDAIAANDPAAVQAVLDQLTAEKQALADAVAANTPAQ